MGDLNPQEARQNWISILSRSSSKELQSHWDNLALTASIHHLRQPETGLVMVRARAGGQGQRFNMGEATVTRCSVRLDSGQIGHGYVTGRDKRHAELAASFDALLQTPQWQAELHEKVINPIANRLSNETLARKQKVAATKVDFFTMARGEDK